MTAELANVAASLTVVEPVERFASLARRQFGGRVQVVQGRIEDLTSVERFDVIVIASLLHHFDAPAAVLAGLRPKLSDDGQLLATVPNTTSLHRRIGQMAGMLRELSDATDRNRLFQQPGRFVKATFEDLFRRSGFDIVESYGYMLKPFANVQMQALALDWPIIEALFELGKDYPDLASHLYVRARSASDQDGLHDQSERT
jgi:2-polyprenyl-3-methyl-5-hydroxy-6-metoxy-1,4-benzoquinol methylase